MADKKISALTGASTPLAGSEVLPIVQGTPGSTVKVSVDNLTAGKAVSALTYASTATTGTAPFTVASTTQVANLNAATAGAAANVSINGQTGLLSFTGLTSTNRIKTVRDAADTVLELDGSYTPTGTWNWGTATVTWPTFNQSTTQSAGSLKSTGTTGLMTIVGPAAGQTRAMTIPDANFTAARTDAAQSFIDDQTLSTGNLVQGTAAKGINFTANTHAAGMTSQLLNWYEEGTWTPTFTSNGTAGNVTTSSLFATYTRVGRVVHVQMSAVLTVTAAPTGIYLIITLPIARKANTSFCGAVAAYNVDLPAGAVGINAIPINETTSDDKAILACSTDNGAWGLVDPSTLVTGDQIMFGFSYIAA